MSRRVKLFKEGAKDSDHRKKALDSFNALIAALKDQSKLQKAQKTTTFKKDEPAVLFYVPYLVPDVEGHDKLWLKFILKVIDGASGLPAARYKTDKSNIAHMIEIYFKTEKKHDITWWNEFVKKNASELLKKRQDSYVHEFVHYLDDLRIGKGEFDKETERQKTMKTTQKINTHLEINAHIQSVMAKLDKMFDETLKNRGKKAAVDMLMKTPQNFIDSMISAKIGSEFFWKNVTDANKKKIMKRLAQFWQEKKSELVGTSQK